MKRTEIQNAAIKLAMEGLSFRTTPAGYARPILEKGKRFVICIRSPWKNTLIPLSRPYLTFAYNGVKYTIGNRAYYNSLEDAIRVRNFWQTLVDNSNTAYSMRKMYIFEV